MHVTVMSSPGCMPCRATKRRLDRRGVRFDEVDVTEDDEAHALAVYLGHQQTPVVVVRDETGEIADHWSGLNPGRIDALAKEPNS